MYSYTSSDLSSSSSPSANNAPAEVEFTVVEVAAGIPSSSDIPSSAVVACVPPPPAGPPPQQLVKVPPPPPAHVVASVRTFKYERHGAPRATLYLLERQGRRECAFFSYEFTGFQALSSWNEVNAMPFPTLTVAFNSRGHPHPAHQAVGLWNGDSFTGEDYLRRPVRMTQLSERFLMSDGRYVEEGRAA